MNWQTSGQIKHVKERKFPPNKLGIRRENEKSYSKNEIEESRGF